MNVLRANRQLRYASPAIRTKAAGHGILLPMSPDTFVTYLPGRSHGSSCRLIPNASSYGQPDERREHPTCKDKHSACDGRVDRSYARPNQQRQGKRCYCRTNRDSVTDEHRWSEEDSKDERLNRYAIHFILAWGCYVSVHCLG